MSSELKLMVEITFSNYLNKTEGGTSELFMRKHGLVKKLMINSNLSLYLVIFNNT